MGNRANVVFTDGERTSATVYLHWNGGPESVYAFLDEMKRRVGGRFVDTDYNPARFAQVVGDFMDGGSFQKAGGLGLSLGIMPAPRDLTLEGIRGVPTDNGDNGFYIVHKDRVDRCHGWPIKMIDNEEARKEEAEARASEDFKAISEWFIEFEARAYPERQK